MEISVTPTSEYARYTPHDEQTVTLTVTGITRTELSRVLIGLDDYNTAAPGRTSTEEFVNLIQKAIDERLA